MNSIIPSNNSPLQHALAKLTERELAELDWRVIVRAHDPQECAPEFLPFLAWENSISDAEGWRFAETEQSKRDLIKSYISVHQNKGTPYVIRQLFNNLGLGEIEILERVAGLSYNGQAAYGGKYIHSSILDGWAYYGIVLNKKITMKEANFVKYILKEIVPARCVLLYLDYKIPVILYNGKERFDDEHVYGNDTWRIY